MRRLGKGRPGRRAAPHVRVILCTWGGVLALSAWRRQGAATRARVDRGEESRLRASGSSWASGGVGQTCLQLGEDGASWECDVEQPRLGDNTTTMAWGLARRRTMDG